MRSAPGLAGFKNGCLDSSDAFITFSHLSCIVPWHFGGARCSKATKIEGDTLIVSCLALLEGDWTSKRKGLWTGEEHQLQLVLGTDTSGGCFCFISCRCPFSILVDLLLVLSEGAPGSTVKLLGCFLLPPITYSLLERSLITRRNANKNYGKVKWTYHFLDKEDKEWFLIYTNLLWEACVKDKLLKLVKGSMYGLQIITPLKFGSDQLRSYEIDWVTCLFAQLFPIYHPFLKFSLTQSIAHQHTNNSV